MSASEQANELRASPWNRRIQPKRRASRPSPVRDLESLEGRLLMATFTVTNLESFGPGSLRRAILDANLTPGADTITFEVAGTIRVARAPLPAITDTVTLDGSSAPNFDGSPVVTIDFRGSRGLNFVQGADGSVLRSLSLVRAGTAAVLLNASRVTVEGNYIGLLADGSTVAGNRGDGVLIRSGRNNRIGTETAGNVIVRNGLYGLKALGVCAGTVVQGNRIAANTAGEVNLTGSRGIVYIPEDGA